MHGGGSSMLVSVILFLIAAWIAYMATQRFVVNRAR